MSTTALVDAIRQGIAAHESLDRARQVVHEETRFRDPVELRLARLRLARAVDRAAEADAQVAVELATWIGNASRCVCAVTPGHVPCSEHDR